MFDTRQQFGVRYRPEGGLMWPVKNPRPRTRKEMAEFANAWDERVKNGEVRTAIVR